MNIKTDATGLATVHFADGSTMRIDHNSLVKITEGTYEPGSGSLRLRAKLVVGRVWSKITALATPASSWEVRTGTAVATVRGTAFSMEASAEGDTLITGSEHNVMITPIDPVTGDELTDATTTVSQRETLKIGKKEIEDIKKLSPSERHTKLAKILVKEKWTEEAKDADWVKINEARDKEIQEEVKKDEAKREEVKPKEPETRKPETKTPEPRPVISIVSLEVRLVGGKLKVTEGTNLTFVATVKLSDGTTKDVTDSVSWQVVGSIGSISKPGVLNTKLGGDVSEIGTAFGAVTARIKTATGELVGKSEIITVTGAVDLQSTQG